MFGNQAPLGSDLNLFFQIGIFVIVLTGFTFARRKRFEIHEKCMFSGIVLVAISFLTWMAPSYIKNFNLVISEFFTFVVFATNIHVILGITAGTMALYIVSRMKLKLPAKFRVKRIRRLMRTTFSLWVFAFSFGVIFYLWYFVF